MAVDAIIVENVLMVAVELSIPTAPVVYGCCSLKLLLSGIAVLAAAFVVLATGPVIAVRAAVRSVLILAGP